MDALEEKKPKNFKILWKNAETLIWAFFKKQL